MFKEKLEKIVRDICSRAYWHGEDTGDYEMKLFNINEDISKILSLLADELPEEKDETDYDGYYVKNWENVRFNQALKEVKTKLGGEMK